MKVSTLKFVQSAAVIAAVAAAGSFSLAYAQDSAPPVVDSQAGTGDTSTAIAPPVDPQSADSNIFNWKDVPTNQQIVIDRAVFDQGGYQLYCHTGETIVVPFTDHNLYVMKFGRSDSGTYFVSDGTTPTLFVPVGGYLENNTVDGAKWYPFPETYDYNAPVYLGVAPDWDAYINMAWYPDMYCVGGYWCTQPYGSGFAFAPMPGFYLSIFDQPYYTWGAYRGYYSSHPLDRYLFRASRVFHYDEFPAHANASLYRARLSASGAFGRAEGVARRPTGGFGHASTDGHFGIPSSSGANSGRSVSPSATHVWGSTAQTARPTSGVRSGNDAGIGSSTTGANRAPFGGLQSLPSNSTRSTWGDGSAHNWGQPTRSYAPSYSPPSQSSHPQPASAPAHSDPPSSNTQKTGK